MLKPLATALVVLLLVPALAFAQWRPMPAPTTPRAGSTSDAQTGNAYNWNRSLDGSTNVRGLNSNTGSQWNTTIQPNGNQRGTDNHGNQWNYNAGSGTYTNSNEKVCVGQGVARVCN